MWPVWCMVAFGVLTTLGLPLSRLSVEVTIEVSVA